MGDLPLGSYDASSTEYYLSLNHPEASLRVHVALELEPKDFAEAEEAWGEGVKALRRSSPHLCLHHLQAASLTGSWAGQRQDPHSQDPLILR